MFSVFFDKTAKCWMVKFKDELGKEKRKRLRKGEFESQIPPDVLHLAERYRPKSGVHSTPTITGTPLRAYSDRYQAIRQSDMRPRSLVTLKGVLEVFVAYCESQSVHTVESVSSRTITDWITDRLKSVCKYTVLSQIGLLSGLFNQAITEDLIEASPVKRGVRKRLREKGDKPTKYHTDDQLKRLLTAIDTAVADEYLKPKYRDAVHVMLGTGMRVDAATHIECEWVVGDKIVVPKDRDKAGYGYTAHMIEPALGVVTRLVETHKTGRIFPTIRTPNRVYYNLRRVCERYGLKDLLVKGCFSHVLRHTFATSLVSRGVPIQVIGALLGHRQIQTTQRYAKVDPTAVSKFLAGVSIA